MWPINSCNGTCRPEARGFAEQGITLAGTNLLTGNTNGGAATYARILTRLGKPDEALTKLNGAMRGVEASHAVPSEVTADAGPEDVAALRQNYLEERRQTAHQQLDRAVTAMGEAVQTFYTPEQKARLCADARPPARNQFRARALGRKLGRTRRSGG